MTYGHTEYCMYPHTKCNNQRGRGRPTYTRRFLWTPPLNTQGLINAVHFIWLFGLISELPANVSATNGSLWHLFYFRGLVTEQAPNEQNWNCWLFKFLLTDTLTQQKDPRAIKVPHVTVWTGVSEEKGNFILTLFYTVQTLWRWTHNSILKHPSGVLMRQK